MSGKARAIAHSNIALAKYWGKFDVAKNLPAVPSLSVTLDAMSTTTTVEFRRDLEADELAMNGVAGKDRELSRVVTLLDRVRRGAGISTCARVETFNDFPTASGLASSASGFAALALAATSAAGLDWDLARVSDLARQSSASAARSVFGGFVTLGAGAPGIDFLPAVPLFDASPSEPWDVAISVAVTTLERKGTGSTDGMGHTQETSPYYRAWTDELAPRLFEEAKRAVLARNLAALGAAAEQSAFAMHASAMAAAPGLIYFSPVTLAAVDRVRRLRQGGTLAFVTIDAGPHVKVLSSGADAGKVADALREVPGVERVLTAKPGPRASVERLEPTA